MMSQYLALKEKYSDCLLFFRLGDFYEMFFEDAVTASKVLDIALTGRDCGLDERVPMVGFPYHAADTYFRKLVDSGYKLAVCETLDDVRCMSKVKNDIIDEDTGEILALGNGNPLEKPPEEPDDDLLYKEKQAAKAFDMDALCKLDELLGQCLNVR